MNGFLGGGSDSRRPALFPVFLDLAGKKCLVVGGGAVALRKVNSLLECGAGVLVIAPEAVEELAAMGREGIIEFRQRQFDDRDIGECGLVFAATGDEQVNQRIHLLCKKAGVLVNVVDDPARCSFFVPASLRRGMLAIAVSTSGSSPLLARRIREELEIVFGREYEDYLEILAESRRIVKERFAAEDDRRKVFDRLLDLDLLTLLRAGEKEAAKERVRQCIFSWPD